MSLRSLNRRVDELRRSSRRIPLDETALFVVLTDMYSYPCFKYYLECREARFVNDLAFFRSTVSFLDSPTFVLSLAVSTPLTCFLCIATSH